jgi:hypothetical protein
MAADAAALGHWRVLTPRLVELTAAHLAVGLVKPVQGFAADNASLLLGLINWFFCHRVLKSFGSDAILGSLAHNLTAGYPIAGHLPLIVNCLYQPIQPGVKQPGE